MVHRHVEDIPGGSSPTGADGGAGSPPAGEGLVVGGVWASKSRLEVNVVEFPGSHDGRPGD